MKRGSQVFVLVLMLLCFKSVVFSGGSVGNGADDFLEGDESAWFTGSGHTVSACIERSTSFPVSEAALENKILSAAGRWRAYYLSKHLDFPVYQIAPPAFVFRFNASCSGSEDLKFYFDVRADEVDHAIVNYDRPVSFAKRTAFDPVTGWGRGFIWFRKTVPGSEDLEWTSPYALDAVITHELGHVLGVSHVSGTIMDARLVKYLAKVQAKPEILEIDQTEELIECGNCAFHHSGNPETWVDQKDAFQEFVGRAPEGNVTFSIARDLDLYGPIFIALKDQKGKYRFELEADGEIAHTIGAPVFATTQAGVTRSFFHGSQTTLWHVKTGVGQTLSVTLSRNTDEMSMSVSYISKANSRLINIIQLNFTH